MRQLNSSGRKQTCQYLGRPKHAEANSITRRDVIGLRGSNCPHTSLCN
jgi:hypothetical protein